MILALVLCLTMASAMAEIKNTQATEFAFATIESGEIMGINYKGVYSFRGVPYATAARFQMPEKVQPWDGVRTCVIWGTICPAEYGANGYTNFTEFMTPADHNFIHNEDCQNLNVWTKSLDAEAKKPVIVFLHGGGFSNGSSMELTFYSGHNITDSGDIVFVSVNHRLNVLGSLDLSAYKVSSNIPGVTCTYVEDRFEGSVVAWCSGAAGNQNPLEIGSPTYHYDGYPEMINLPDGASFALMELYGQRQGIDAIRCLESIDASSDTMQQYFGKNTVELPAQKAPEGADMGCNRLLADNLVRKVTGTTEIPERKLVEMVPDNPVIMKQQIIVLGDIALVGIPAEI